MAVRSARGIAFRLLIGVICFTLGNIVCYYNLIDSTCVHHLDPNHQADEALRQGFHGLKRHKTFLVVVILSASPHRDQRQAIRETWLDFSPSLRQDVLYFFVVGTLGLPDAEQADLDTESAQHKDLLKLPVAEEFQQLTNKVLSTFVQIDRNVQFSYLMKVDDDTFVRVGDIVEELKHSNYQTLFYWGFFDGRAPVIRQESSKWHEPDYVLCDRYIPYALGGGYVLSSDVVAFVAANSAVLKVFRNEDVSVGTWLAPLRLNRVHDVRFDTEHVSRGCSNKHLVSHKQSPSDMRKKHASLAMKGVLCEEEGQVRNSYKYNWALPPSKCCVRDDSSLP